MSLVSIRFRTIINTLIRIGPAILTFGQLILVSHANNMLTRNMLRQC